MRRNLAYSINESKYGIITLKFESGILAKCNNSGNLTVKIKIIKIKIRK